LKALFDSTQDIIKKESQLYVEKRNLFQRLICTKATFCMHFNSFSLSKPRLLKSNSFYQSKVAAFFQKKRTPKNRFSIMTIVRKG